MTNFRGVLVPVLTPFDTDLRINHDAFLVHCRWLLQRGVDGLAVFGTTSEANSLSLDERTELLEHLVASGIPPDRLLPGTGTCAIPDSVRLTRQAVELGCRGVLMLPPFYYKDVDEEGLFAFYSEIIERVGSGDLRIYLYHIPPIARISLSIGLIARLINAYPDTVKGIKDSSGDWSNTQTLLREFPGFATFSGSENYLLATVRGGGAGCISATANVNPAGIRQVFEHWRTPEAEQLQARATKIRDAFQAFPLIAALKAELSGFYTDPGWKALRPPLVMLPAERAMALREHLKQLAFSMGTQP